MPEWSTAQGPIVGPATIATPWDIQTPSSFLTAVTGRWDAAKWGARRPIGDRRLFAVHVDDGQLTQIRDAWRTGTPLGNDRFKEAVEAMLGRKIGQVTRGRPKKTSSNTL